MRYLIILILIAVLLASGCTGASSVPASSTPAEIRIANVTSERIHYNWIEVKGLVVNDGPASHSVSGYVDLYDSNKVKFDHCLFLVDVDAHGKASWKITSTDAEKYNGVTMKYYLDTVY